MINNQKTRRVFGEYREHEIFYDFVDGKLCVYVNGSLYKVEITLEEMALNREKREIAIEIIKKEIDLDYLRSNETFFKKMIRLSDEVVHRETGFTGIVIGRIKWSCPGVCDELIVLARGVKNGSNAYNKAKKINKYGKVFDAPEQENTTMTFLETELEVTKIMPTYD